MTPRYGMVSCYVVQPDSLGALNELLQLHRAPGEFMAGAWSIVRGRIQAPEKAWQAALRELKEETGLVPGPGQFFQLDTVDTFYLAADDSVWHVPGFCAVVGRNATITLNSEHDNSRWVSRDQVDQEFLWPGERRQVEEIIREIMDDGPAKQYLGIRDFEPTW